VKFLKKTWYLRVFIDSLFAEFINEIGYIVAFDIGVQQGHEKVKRRPKVISRNILRVFATRLPPDRQCFGSVLTSASHAPTQRAQGLGVWKQCFRLIQQVQRFPRP